jgi:hypothetical protein
VEGCDYRCKSFAHLWSHKKYKHSNDRPFRCSFPECSYRGKTRVDFTKHRQKHRRDQMSLQSSRDGVRGAMLATESGESLNSCLIDVHMSMRML